MIFPFILTIFSCGKTTEESVSEAVSKTNDTVNDTAGSANNAFFGENYGIWFSSIENIPLITLDINIHSIENSRGL